MSLKISGDIPPVLLPSDARTEPPLSLHVDPEEPIPTAAGRGVDASNIEECSATKSPSPSRRRGDNKPDDLNHSSSSLRRSGSFARSIPGLMRAPSLDELRSPPSSSRRGQSQTQPQSRKAGVLFRRAAGDAGGDGRTCAAAILLDREIFNDELTPPHSPLSQSVSSVSRSQTPNNFPSVAGQAADGPDPSRPPSGRTQKEKASVRLVSIASTAAPVSQSIDSQSTAMPGSPRAHIQRGQNSPADTPLTPHDATYLDLFNSIASSPNDPTEETLDSVLSQLRRLSWLGCPPRCRYPTWCVLSGLWPISVLAQVIRSSPALSSSQPPTTATNTTTNTSSNNLNHSDHCTSTLDRPLPTLNVSAAVRQRRALEYRTLVKHNYEAIPWELVLTEESQLHSMPASESARRATALAMIGQEELNMMRQIRKDLPRTQFGGSFSLPSSLSEDRVPELWCALSDGERLLSASSIALLPNGYTVRGIPPLLKHPTIRAMLERILYLWALRHPACGYVQGMNDLLVPFLIVVLAEGLFFGGGRHGISTSKSCENNERSDVDAAPVTTEVLKGSGDTELAVLLNADESEITRRLLERGLVRSSGSGVSSSADYYTSMVPSKLSPSSLLYVLEGDAYFIFSRFMDTLQTNYTAGAMSELGGNSRRDVTGSSQEKVSETNLVSRLEDVVRRADPEFHALLSTTLQIPFQFFAFRWMNCMLQRELAPATLGLRLWDTYLSELSSNTATGSNTTSSANAGSGGGPSTISSENSSATSIAAYHVFVSAAILLEVYKPLVLAIVAPAYGFRNLGLLRAPTKSSEDVLALSADAGLALSGGGNASSGAQAEPNTPQSTSFLGKSSRKLFPTLGQLSGSSPNAPPESRGLRRTSSVSSTSSSAAAARRCPQAAFGSPNTTDVYSSLDIPEDSRDGVAAEVLTLLQNPAMLLNIKDIAHLRASLQAIASSQTQTRSATANGPSTPPFGPLSGSGYSESPPLSLGGSRPPSGSSAGLSPQRPCHAAAEGGGGLGTGSFSEGLPQAECSHFHPQPIAVVTPAAARMATQHATRRLEEILSRAFVLQTYFDRSPAQLASGVGCSAGSGSFNSSSGSPPTPNGNTTSAAAKTPTDGGAQPLGQRIMKGLSSLSSRFKIGTSAPSGSGTVDRKKVLKEQQSQRLASRHQ